MNDNTHGDDVLFETWLKQSNDKLIASTAENLDTEAMLTQVKRKAVRNIGTARSKPHQALRDLAHAAAGTVAGALALKPPYGTALRQAKVLHFPTSKVTTEPESLPNSPQGPAEGIDSLAAAATEGECDAVEALLTAIRPLVVRYCRARIGQQERSFASADDVAQEICLSVLTALPGYRNQERPFLAFVYGIAARQVAKAHTAAARSREEPIAQVPDRPSPELEPQQRIEQDELSQRMSQLLALLPDRQREILVLRVVIGLSAEETAHVLGITTATVRVAQHWALVRLRKNLSATESL